MIRFFRVVLFWAAASGAAAAELSAGDEAIYRTAFDLAKLRQFDAALTAGAAADDKRLLKVLEWQYDETANSGADFEKITAFIRDNPDWPLLGLLRRRAEEAITPLTPAPAVLAWFDKNPPLTVPGKMAYADLLLGQGRKELAIQLLRKSWIGTNFDEDQERTFLAKFGEFLPMEDEGPRLDRLLWEHQDAAVKRQIPRVDPDLQLLAKARVALHGGTPDAEAMAVGLPEKFRDDPGLIYEWTRYRRGHDNLDGAIQLLRHPAHDKGPADLWWTERSLLVRALLLKGDASVAYDIAQNHGLVSGGDFAEAEWLSGWIALRFLKDAEQGLGHFTRLYDHVSLPQSRARAAYWAGRACVELGRGDDAANWFTLAARNPTTFHGQLAAGRLRPDAVPPLPSDPQPTDQDRAAFEHQDPVQLIHLLAQIKEAEPAGPFLLKLAETAQTPVQRELIAELATAVDRLDVAVTVSRQSDQRGAPLFGTGYPVLPSTSPTPEPALVLGLIRQESGFKADTVSKVGALGLMQVMPDTAAELARKLGVAIAPNHSLKVDLLHDPALNMRLGGGYLDRLLGQFNGSYILTAAAYDAGPARVKGWLRDLGDPRQPGVDAIDWIERMPYSETRDYVEHVLANTQIYRRKLGVAEVPLEKDLTR